MTKRAGRKDKIEDIDRLPVPPMLRLSGDFINRITIIPTTNSSILLGTAILDDSEQCVLIPYIETKVAGIKQNEITAERFDEEKFDTVMSETLPLENALFYAWDFVRDIHVSCSNLVAMSGGNLAIEPVRLAHAAFFAEQVQQQAELCAATIRSLIAGSTRTDA